MSHETGVAVLALETTKMDETRLAVAIELLERHPRIDTVLIDPDGERLDSVAGQVIVLAGSVRPEQLQRLPRLEWYQQWGAGADGLLRHAWAREAPFTLTNVAGIHGIQIGEHVFGMLLALLRDLPEAIRAQTERRWYRPESLAPLELAGARMLVLGFGAIGRRIAHLARAFDMSVDVIKRSAGEPPGGVHRVGTHEDLLTFLPDADAVVITLPLTDATRGLFGADAFARMKRSAYLVNIGRGGIVDEAALVEALREGRLAGAGFDVFDEEPLPGDSPLWDAPRLLITGHYAGNSFAYDQRALEVFLQNIERWVDGEPLTHVVDKQLGY